MLSFIFFSLETSEKGKWEELNLDFDRGEENKRSKGAGGKGIGCTHIYILEGF